jgi:hypothetical protein
MASDFTVAKEVFSKRTVVFYVTDQTPNCGSFVGVYVLMPNYKL